MFLHSHSVSAFLQVGIIAPSISLNPESHGFSPSPALHPCDSYLGTFARSSALGGGGSTKPPNKPLSELLYDLRSPSDRVAKKALFTIVRSMGGHRWEEDKHCQAYLHNVIRDQTANIAGSRALSHLYEMYCEAQDGDTLLHTIGEVLYNGALPDEAAPQVLGWLFHNNVRARHLSANIMRKLGFYKEFNREPMVQALLRTLLSDPAPSVRLLAAERFYHFPDARAQQALQQALHDPDGLVRHTARMALDRSLK